MSNETLVRCCAPTMACLKTGNMFSCAFDSRKQMTEELRYLNQRLRKKGLRILPLRWRDGKALLYLYRPKLLERDLRDPLSRKLLLECGYTCENANDCLARLISRLRTEEDFPHEVGLFLGYPPADVDGFMHRKDECKLCGLWKSMTMCKARSSSLPVAGAVRRCILTACPMGFRWRNWRLQDRIEIY